MKQNNQIILVKKVDKLGKWLSKNNDYDFDPCTMNRVPITRNRNQFPGELYISDLSGLSKAVDCGIDIVISMCFVPYTLDIEHYIFNVRDEPSEKDKMLEVLSTTNRLIDSGLRSGKKILVHCAEGMSRSATVVLYYLLLHKPHLETCIFFLKKIRPIIHPNKGFLELLVEQSEKSES
jgi:hypothetical protein